MGRAPAALAALLAGLAVGCSPAATPEPSRPPQRVPIEAGCDVLGAADVRAELGTGPVRAAELAGSPDLLGCRYTAGGATVLTATVARGFVGDGQEVADRFAAGRAPDGVAQAVPGIGAGAAGYAVDDRTSGVVLVLPGAGEQILQVSLEGPASRAALVELARRVADTRR